MSYIEILTPSLAESVADATVLTWHKKIGDTVLRDDVLVEIETDKVVLEVVAPKAGVLTEIFAQAGEKVLSDAPLGRLTAENGQAMPQQKGQEIPQPAPQQIMEKNQDVAPHLSPSVRRLLAQHDLNISDLTATDKKGRLSKEELAQHLKKPAPAQTPSERAEKRQPLSRLRQRLSERLLATQQQTAMLTTFNEIDMSAIQALRKRYGEPFQTQHGVRLGLMSFYLKAVSEALKRYPVIHARIEKEEIITPQYMDISIAVSTPRGLVTPVLRRVEQKSLTQLEREIAELAHKGRDSKLTLADLEGGSFTLTNGGVFGSLLSTPLINPPQSAILGIHAIKDRPVAVAGEVVIRPMMYVALSYDHCLIDGKDSVGFLKAVKEYLEDPALMLLGL